MLRLLVILSSLLVTGFTQYALDFKDTSATLTYRYSAPWDFTDAVVSVRLNLDYDHYNKIFQEDETLIDIITIRSPSGTDDLFDYMAFQLMGSGSDSGPPIFMIIISSPLSSGDTLATTFCLPMITVDLNDRLITVNKKGAMFTIDIEGFADDNGDNYFCQNYPIGAPETGRMELSTISVGPNLVGCISELSFPGVNLLPGDDCGFPVDFLSGNAAYFEGTCQSEVKTDVVCPTTPPQPTTTPSPTTPTTKPPTTPTQPPSTPTQPPTTPTRKSLPPTKEGSGLLTDGNVSTTVIPIETDTKTKPQTEPKTEPKEQPDIKTEPKEGLVTDPRELPKTDAKVEPTVGTGGEITNNETDEENEGDDDNEYTVLETDTEASTGTEGRSSSVVIIICVVSAGIVVIVVLLYVGYRFHFRDKGSYKLEEVKGEPTGEDFGNEYAELNPTVKDQEWYL